jgi:diguanylate cyclase (GGDEF)-like protein
MTIRRLRLIALLGALFFVGISVVVTLWGLDAQRDDALLINLAGRQRMLIQQMALESLDVQIADNPTSRQMLHEAADLFEQTLNALTYGGETRYTEETTVNLRPPDENDPEIRAQLETVREAWNEIHSAIHILLENDPQSAAFAEAMNTVETLSPVLLARMDEAVRLYESDSEGKVAFVRAIQISFLASAAILLIFAFAIIEYRVLHPIAHLDEAARRIGTGDLGTPISITGLGELDQLADSLDEMRTRLKVAVEAQARRAQEAETLRQAGAVVAASLRQDEAIERILEQLARVVPYDSASVMLLSEGYLEIVGGRGWKDPAEVIGLRFPVPGDNPNTLVIQQGRLHILGDAPSEYAAFGEGPQRHIRSWLGIPLIVGERVIGMLSVDNAQPNFFTPDHAHLAAAFADQVGIAIENARLFTEAEKHAEQLRALRAAGHALTSDLRIEAVLQTLIETTRRLVGASYAALGVLDEDGSLSQFHTTGITDAERQKIGESPKGLGLLGALIREGAPIRVADIARDARSIGFPPNHPPMKTFMGVPIVAHGKVMGSLYLTEKMNGQAFSPDDEDLVVGLAADAAIAIENARLFGKVEQLAITDSLTGLHNRRHFLELAEHEFQRARRYKRPMSMIMLDIDRFKQVNDTYGHAVGDQVLRAVATRCHDTLRTIDFMGRFGGEEFILLLPENNLDGACNAAERLRQRVAEDPIETERGPVSVTISLGVAAIAADCPDLKTLLERVDAALYAAKKAGRNRVEGRVG